MRTRGRSRTLAVVAVLTAILAAGCDMEYPNNVPGDFPPHEQESVMGANAEVGDILLRSVHIEAPAVVRYHRGDDAKLWLTLINDGLEPDALTAVSSPVASGAQIRWDADCNGTAEPVPTLPLRPAFPAPVESPGGVRAFDSYHVMLLGLEREVLAGTAIPVTFTFRRAGQLTVDTFVQPSNAPRAEPSRRCIDEPPTPPRAARR